MKGIVATKLPDAAWGFPTVARVIPRDGDPWGCLSILRGTPWEPLIPLIPDSVFDQALRGFATPLMRILGPPPKALVKRLPLAETTCAMKGSCVSFGPNCVPGSKVPDCWEPSSFFGPDAEAVNYLVRLWREGTLVIVVVPDVIEG